jgi:RNA polymerase-associated protein CTR9
MQYLAASEIVHGQDTSVLLFLARAYYQLGSKEMSFPAMTKALGHCMKAAHLKPHDKAILHNVAMIQQKSAEIVLGLEPSKRSLQEVEQVIEQAESSTTCVVSVREMAYLLTSPLVLTASSVTSQRLRKGLYLTT